MPSDDADPGGRTFLDFQVVAEEAGIHSVTVTYDHAEATPLALGFALDRAQIRTVRYPPLPPGATRRTMSLDVDMRRGPAVIRVAEGATGTRLRVHSLRGDPHGRDDADAADGSRAAAAPRLTP
ncbi:hypothetical protein [Clavibacter zhangzhiyongii]|uniref:hypothetical protein n=1 Tax=Clavibacter zhangzhiyongii TaxID=2768071 RepID=UPI0039DFA1D9